MIGRSGTDLGSGRSFGVLSRQKVSVRALRSVPHTPLDAVMAAVTARRAQVPAGRLAGSEQVWEGVLWDLLAGSLEETGP